ncbi:hypothetical protein ACH5RR_026885 [Cinchona calisaya]|uniref:Uncharacterized protein n=1 Tax=Cinchona calisaya TaxID=153742 RepID=A0ABD2Z3V8_9GENT
MCPSIFAANSSTLVNVCVSSVVTFNGFNFAEWKEQVEYQLGIQDLDQFILEENTPAPSEDDIAEERVTRKTWDRSNRLGLKFIRTTITANTKSMSLEIHYAKEF